MNRLTAIIATLIVAALAACGTVALRTGGTFRSPLAPSGPAARALPASITGIVSNNLAAFDAKCGCRPNVAVHYVRWGEDPPDSQKLASEMITSGASPMLEIAPYGTTLDAIIAGQDDRWLRSYAHMVRSLKSQVLLSFAPEANGNWYTWGWTHSQPSAEVAAWRHVVTLFRASGVDNAHWVWIINQLWPGSGPLPSLWPGARYVDEVGVDGYFRSPSATFTSVFVPTINAVHRLAPGKPVLITETGADPQAGKARAIAALTAGIRQYKLPGFVWFDINQGNDLPSHADWSLDDTPSALAAYRNEANGHGTRPTG